MACKRGGDDLIFLKKMKHQRVSELLGTYIPEDEAKFLTNGRLVCTICHQHPVFDTVTLLSKHRKGKIHLLELSRHLNRLRKREFLYVPFKNQQLDALTSLDDKMSVLSISQPLPGKGCHTDLNWHKTLDIAMLNPANRIMSLSEHESSPKQSSASEVHRYLSTLHRKRPLKSQVEWKKKNYGGKATNKQNVTLTETTDSYINIEPLKEKIINEQHH